MYEQNHPFLGPNNTQFVFVEARPTGGVKEFFGKTSISH